jgi:L-iditol 2-dehydrogenase
MRAYVYAAPGKLRVAETARPVAGLRGALMQVSVSSICGTDIRTHRFGNASLRPPRIIGHEACGTLVEVGAEVKGFHEGDRVLVVPAIGCGACPSCRRGWTNMCSDLRTIGFEYDGTFADYVEIPERAFDMGNVLRLEKGISDAEAALTEPTACCLNGQSFLRIEPEDVVFVFGAGFIGCIHAELALQRRAARVILSDVSTRRLRQVSKLLSSDVELLNSSETDAAQFIKETTSGLGADVIITACAAGETHAAAMEISARRARISLFGGLPEKSTGFLDSNAIHYKELAVYGSHASTAAENRRILEIIATRQLDIAKYASRTYPLESIDSAFEDLKNEDVLKVLVVP